MRFIIKIIVSAVVLVVVSEIGKRTSFWGGLIASIPFTSLLALLWLFVDTGDKEKVSKLSMNIFWFVLPSLIFFVVLPVFISKFGLNVYLSMFLSAVITMFAYWGTGLMLSRFGIHI